MSEGIEIGPTTHKRIWKQIQLIQRRTKNKRKWTQGKEEQFSLILEGEEQQIFFHEGTFIAKHSQLWQPKMKAKSKLTLKLILSQPRGKKNFKPCLLPMYSFLLLDVNFTLKSPA
jgi:hypothetical protein